MAMTTTAVRTRRAPAGTRLVSTVVLAALLAACGQGSTGAGATAPGTAETSPTAPGTGDGMDETPDPTVPPSGVPSTDLTPAPSGAPSGAAGGAVLPSDPAGADLVLVAGPPGAEQPPVTLVCDWAGATSGGTHPQAVQACVDLLAALQAGDPFAPVAPDTMCTQQYGGDAVVQVTGTVLAADGSPVAVTGTFTLTDGCQIARFDAMGAVLAPFRGSV